MNIVLLRSNPVRPYPRLEKMAKCLIEYGYGVTVLAWDRDSDYPPRVELLELGSVNCRIVRIGLRGQFAGGIKKNLKGLLKFQHFIYRWLVEHKNEYDVIHAYDLDTGFTAQKAAYKTKKVFVYDIPDYYSNGHGYTGIIRRISNKIENGVIDKAFSTIICSEERKEEIKGSHPKNLYVIHNTPNMPIQPIKNEHHGRIRFAYIGVFGTTRFLKEMTEFVAQRKDIELHIGGYGANMEFYFEKMAQKYENITFYGRIPYSKTIEIERNCDILPVIYDPSLLNHKFAAPNKFYEALALGKPIIMAKGTGMSTIVEQYDLGETIEYTIESLEKAVNRLIDRKDKWKEIGEREQNLYRTSYSWDEMKKRIHKLYDSIELILEEK